MRAAARGSAVNLIGAACSALVSLAVVLVVTHGLQRSAAGVVFAVTSAFLVVETVVRLGTDVGVVHFVAVARAQRLRHEVSELLWASLIPVVATAIVGSGIAVLVTRAVVDSLGTTSGGIHLRALAAAVALAVPVAAIYDLLTAATRGLGTSRPTVVVERLIRPLLQMAGVAAAGASHAAAFGIVVAWVAPYAVVAPVMAVWLVRLLRAQQIPLRPGSWHRRFFTVWRFTLPRSFASVAQILLQRLDIIIVGALLGAPAAAVYTGATRFVVVGQLGNQAMSYAFQPQLARLIGRGELAEARALFRTSTAWIVGLTAPLYLSICVSSSLLVRLLGRHYHAGLSALVVVTGAMLVANACGMVDIVLITMGRTTWNLANTVVALVLNVGLDVWLVQWVGIIGAAVGWAVAILATNLVPLAQIHRSFGFSPLSAVWVRLVAVIGLLFGVIPGVALVVAGPRVWLTAALLAIALMVYVGLVWRWRAALNLESLVPRALRT